MCHVFFYKYVHWTRDNLKCNSRRQVSMTDARKALDENFGGEDENPPVAPGFGATPAFKFTKYSNAYMLVYIRASDWDQVL